MKGTPGLLGDGRAAAEPCHFQEGIPQQT